MLHLISSNNHVQQALSFITDGDAVLFMESSTLSLLKNSALIKDLQLYASKVSCYTLAPDLQLRGLANDELPEIIRIIDYSEFVALTIEHNVIKTWN